MGMIIYTNEFGHMTNMATMPIYGQNRKKSSSQEARSGGGVVDNTLDYQSRDRSLLVGR